MQHATLQLPMQRWVPVPEPRAGSRPAGTGLLCSKRSRETTQLLESPAAGARERQGALLTTDPLELKPLQELCQSFLVCCRIATGHG